MKSDKSDLWTIHRDKIKQLYLVDRLIRDRVRAVMSTRYRFHATDRQYKSMIEKKWQLQKILTYEDKKFIILKTLQRQQQKDGRPTKFLLSGQTIDSSKLSRKRKDVLAAETEDQDLGTLPENLIYYTPPNSPTQSSSTSWLSSTNEKPYLVADRPTCITCIACERDCYGFSTGVLLAFDEHLRKVHKTSLSATSALVSCSTSPKTLTECGSYDHVLQWDADERKAMFRDLSSFPSFTSLSSISVIQQDSPSTLWLIDACDPDHLNVLGTLAKCSDPTPRPILAKLINESSAAGGDYDGTATESLEDAVSADVDSMNSGFPGQEQIMTTDETGIDGLAEKNPTQPNVEGLEDILVADTTWGTQLFGIDHGLSNPGTPLELLVTASSGDISQNQSSYVQSSIYQTQSASFISESNIDIQMDSDLEIFRDFPEDQFEEQQIAARARWQYMEGFVDPSWLEENIYESG